MAEKKERKKKWTHERLRECAAKYTARGDFLKNDTSAYMTAKRLGIYEEITAHMPAATLGRRGPSGPSKWTAEKIIEIALMYETKSEFYRAAPGAYKAAQRSKELWEKATAHMPRYAGKGKKRGPNVRTLSKAANG